MRGRKWQFHLGAAALVTAITAMPAIAQLNLGSEELVAAGGGDIAVLGYSVPSVADWNNDGLPDLIVGEGGGAYPDAKVRVYLNEGTAEAPQFSGFVYAQSGGVDLIAPGSGCLGLFPRVVHWDGDGRKDLLIGQSDGIVKVFLNNATDEAPAFDGGTVLQLGEPGSKVDLDVGYRATPSVVDWNSDGVKDLVVGAMDSKVHVFINEGTDAAPDFRVAAEAQSGGSALLVPSARSSPTVLDVDGDGKKDLVAGNTNGELLLYGNVGTDAAPTFAGYVPIEADGVAIDLPGTPRSRPCLCDWTGDGVTDVVIGAADGNVHLYMGVPTDGIPAVSAWGVFAMLLLMLTAGTLAYARQRPIRV